MADLDLGDIETQERRESGSGVVVLGGVLLNMEDYNPDLRGQQATAKWEEMRRADPEIASGLARLVWPIVAAEWKIVPADDTDEEKEIASFCEKWIFGEGRTDPFAMRKQDFLRHALLMVAEGFSAFEKVWGTDREGRQIYSQLAPIMAKTVWEFHFLKDGTGGLDFMRQRTWTTDRGYQVVDIPAEKLVLFIFGREGDNLFGWPLLRQVYKPWYFKDKLWKIDAIRHERHGVGFTVIKVPRGAPKTIRDRAEKVGREARVHERQYAVIEEGQEFDILYPRGQGTDIISSIKYLDAQISQVLFSEFMHLGASESGSRATAKSKIDFMLSALQGVITLVEEVINAQLIVPLVARNWGAREKWPHCEGEDLSKMAGTDVIELMAKLLNVQVNAITPGPDIEKYLRQTLQLPPMPEWLEEAMVEAQKIEAEHKANPPEPPVIPAAENGNALSAQPGQEQKQSSMNGGVSSASPRKLSGTAHIMFMGAEVAPIGSPVSLSRGPMPHEIYCAFAEMKSYMRDEPQRIWHRVVEPYRKRAALRIASKASGLPDDKLAARDFGAMPGIRIPFEEDLSRALLKVYSKGRLAVLGERKRQLAGTSITPATVARALQEDDDEEFDIEPTKKQRDWVSTLAVGFVGALITGMVSEASRAGLAARQAELSARQQEARVLEAVNALSPAKQQVELSGAVARTFGTGRTEQAYDMRDQIDREYYSAVMDDNTCMPCSALDGAEQEPGAGDFETPNPECLGDDNCRCVTIEVFRQEAA